MKKQTARNAYIVSLFKEGRSSGEIKELLAINGYSEISRYRIWSIYKASPNYEPTKTNLRYCHFCIVNKLASDMYYGCKRGQYKAKFRMCNDCYERLLPIQPIKQENA